MSLNQNLTKCLTYNENTDFFGAVNPNTHVWADLLYAGFNKNDVLYKAIHNDAKYKRGAGTVSVSADSLVFNGPTTGGISFTLLTTPININANTKLKLEADLFCNDNSNKNHCSASVFITDDITIIDGSTASMSYNGVWINDSRVLVLKQVNLVNTTERYSIDTNLANLIVSKYTDLSKQYYIGVAGICAWTDFYGRATINTCETY